ncbi:MAG: hypothetical protein WC340_05985 [Kiritimatiellia bacterium]
MNKQCPICDSPNVATYSWKHPLMLHWIINPGLAFNEVFLGQRLPSISYVCRDCKLPLPKRNWIICPHCSETTMATVWMGKHSFCHWLGVMCPHCGKLMPSLWNLTSRVLIAVLCPLWIGPYFLFRDKYLDWERNRADSALKKQTNDEDTGEQSPPGDVLKAAPEE